MHSSVLSFIERIASDIKLEGKRVLEVGSYNVNGSPRPTIESFQPALYYGVDVVEQDGFVDEVLDVHQLLERFGPESWDVVVVSETLEHIEDWRGALANVCGVLKAKGVVIMTARGPGFVADGVDDHWRFTTQDAAAMFQDFSTLLLCDDPQPHHSGVLYAGVKRGLEPALLPAAPSRPPASPRQRLNVRKTHPRPLVSLQAFYHVAAMGNWKDVVREQCRAFTLAGLRPRAYLLGSEEDEEWLRRRPLDVIGRSPDLHDFETPTLQAIYEFCQEDQGAVLYCHTKGVSQPDRPTSKPWREVMMRGVVDSWRANLYRLAVADVTGVGWCNGDWPHFRGNFWMARSDWVANLLDPVTHRARGGPYFNGNSVEHSWDRMHAEMWVGSKPECFVECIGDLDSPLMHLDYLLRVLRESEEEGWAAHSTTLLRP